MLRAIAILCVPLWWFPLPTSAGQTALPLKSKQGTYTCTINHQVAIFPKQDGTIFAGEVPLQLNEFALSIRRLRDNPMHQIFCDDAHIADGQA